MKKFKHTFLAVATVFCLFLSMISCAQSKEKRQRIRAIKTAHITQELDLSPSEAEKFWPIYNEADTKLIELRMNVERKIKQQLRDQSAVDAMSDAEAETLLAQLMQVEQQRAEIKNKLYLDLKKVISAKQIIKLHKSEMNFNRRLLKEFRRKHHNRMQ